MMQQSRMPGLPDILSTTIALLVHRTPLHHMAAFDFHPLEPAAYDLVVIDAPQPFKTRSPAGQKKSGEAHYQTMTMADIAALPVRDLLKPNAIVFSWSTAPRLPEMIRCLEGWGVTYRSHMVWRKLTRNGKQRPGTGFWCRSLHEMVLLGAVGNPPLLKFPSLFDGVARQHSRKPAEFFELIEQRTPGWRRADVFARERRAGWDSFGDQVDLFGGGGSP